METHRDGLGHTILQTDITLNLHSQMLNQSAGFIAGHKSVWSLFSFSGFPLLLGDMVRVSGLGLVRVWTGMQQEKWPLKIVHKDLAMYSYT